MTPYAKGFRLALHREAPTEEWDRADFQTRTAYENGVRDGSRRRDLEAALEDARKHGAAIAFSRPESKLAKLPIPKMPG